MRRGRGVLAGLLVLVLVFGIGGAQPTSEGGGTGGMRISLDGVRDWLRELTGLGPQLVDGEPGLAPIATGALPRREPVPVGAVAPEVERIGELSDLRTESAVFYELSDGRVQAEISSAPVHYRDDDGVMQPIDTRVVASDRAGVAFENVTNRFTSVFGETSDRLASFVWGDREITIGLPGKARAVEVNVDGSVVTFPDVLGDGVDVRYQVGGSALKEEIVLAGPPADGSFTFTLDLDGLTARSMSDGAIGFYDTTVGGGPVLRMPPPFMFDSGDDPESPYGAPWSGSVTQQLRLDGGQLLVEVSADEAWLADAVREYPVVIDPTIAIQPTPSQSQDAMILSDAPDTNYDGNWRLSVGTTTLGQARSMVRFDLSGVPDGVELDDASLQLYYDQTHTTNEIDVPLEARRVTQVWDAATVTWNSAAAHVGERGAAVEMVDDSDSAKVAKNGVWPISGSPLTAHGINQNYHFNNTGEAGQTFTWVPELPADGQYRVQAHYVAAFDRATNAPYTVHHAGGQTTVEVNQQAGDGGVWADLGTYEFNAGTSHQVTLGNVPGHAVIADAVRFIRDGEVVKQARQSSVWHQYPVRNIVQDWLDGQHPNHGFAVKAVDEAHLGKGGPRYSAAEYAYGGESRHTPTLVLTWGRPSVALQPPTTIHATGAELEWSDYDGEDLLEYQVHRAVFQHFTPSQQTLVAPVAAGTTSFVDTTATPTPVDDPDPFGQVYYYMVVVKTTDGQLIPSPTQIVRLPRAGRTVEIVRGDAADTTLSAARPDENHDALDGRSWLMAGNNSFTYGTSRAVLDFADVSERIPAGAQVLSARFGLWSTDTIGSGAAYDVHPLTRGFDETTATWNHAATGDPWTTPGGDFGAALDTVPEITNDPSWHRWDVEQVVQGWVNDPASNHGLLVKLADESGPSERTLFLSSETAEPALRPGIVITYTEATPMRTYHAPDTPAARMIPGDDYTIPVTISNPTGSTWPADQWQLSYRWELPDGTDVTTGGNQLSTPLPGDVAPGEAVEVDAALRTPIQSDAGNKRTSYVLRWELRNTVTGQWLSAAEGIGPLDQNVVVEDPTSDQLGLEHFYQYAGVGLGAGQTAMVNTHSGNLTVSYRPFAHPGQGLATHVGMTYNSRDTSASSMGYGWSLSGSTITRLGSPLEFHPKGQQWPTEVTLIDGTGTSHTFTLNTHGSQDPADWSYDKPAGVHLHLTPHPGGDQSRAWVMTKPDRTQFFFDTDGYPSAVVDNNGNTQTFTYQQRRSANQPTKFLQYVTDPTGRQTLTLEYYQRGQDYTYIDDDGNPVQDTNLTNPHIIDQVKAITDIDGRRIELFYTDKGLTAKLVDGAGTQLAKTFSYSYDMLQGNNNVKLVGVTDPRGNTTDLSYYNPPPEPRYRWWAESITARDGAVSTFSYQDPDEQHGSTMHTTVTDPEGNQTLYVTDGFGRPTAVTDALGETTTLAWDADNNVIELTEANGAVTSWTYDEKTGYPLTITDPQANAEGTAPTVLTYQTGLDGHIADLTSKTSPEGRTWQFGYDQTGNLTEVVDPLGVAEGDPGEFTTTHQYDTAGRLISTTDANGNQTTFSDYHPTGFPQTITDALGETVESAYDERGNVLAVTDELDATTTIDYDLFGRPLDVVTPLDQPAGEFITTPAPVYDPNDNIVIESAPNGAVTTYDYDPTDRVITTEAPKDHPGDPDRVTSFTYDLVGNLTAVTEPLGNLPDADSGSFTTTYNYDAAYQLIGQTDAEGNTTTYSYDQVGNLTDVTDARGNTTSYTYDLNGQLLQVTDPAGHSVTTEYDLDGLPVATTDQQGVTTETVYDARGMVTETRQPHRDGVTRITRYEYDQVGNTTRVISPRGVERGDGEAFTQQTIYDELNRPIEQILPYDPQDANHSNPDSILYEYDAAGRVTLVSAPPSHGQQVRNDTVTEYFDTGWVRRTSDPWGIVTEYDYNPLGQQTGRTLISASGVADRTMTWDYLPDGKLAARSDDGIPAGLHVVLVDNSDQQHVTVEGTWTNTDTGEGFIGFDYARHHEADPDAEFTWTLNIPQDGDYEIFTRWPEVVGAATDADYTIVRDEDEDSVTVDQTVQAGTWVSLGTYEFTEGADASVVISGDADGTVLADAIMAVRDNTGEAGDTLHKDITYSYDTNGNLTEIVDQSSGAPVDTYTVAYDGLNRVVEIQELAAGTVDATTSFTYNEVGAPLTRTHDGGQASFVYDQRNLLTSVTNTEAHGGSESKVTSYTYNPRGQRVTETKANDNTVEFTYWLDGSLHQQTETKPDGTLVAEHSYTYDLNGNRASDISRLRNADNPGDLLQRQSTFTYDPRDRVATVTRTDLDTGQPAGSESYTHDANNNVISQTINGTTTTNVYDRNRLQTSSIDGAASTYNYDPFGRLDTVTTAGEVVQRQVYDGFDRIIEKHTQTAVTVKTYDPLDRVLTETIDDDGQQQTRNLTYLGLTGQVLAEYIDGQLDTTYQHGLNGQLLSQTKHGDNQTSEDSVYSYNPHGDVVGLSDEHGDTRATYGYTAYGADDQDLFTGVDRPDPGQPATDEPYNLYRFSGKRWDPNAGTYDMGFRDYNPGLNRFLTRDMFNGALADMHLTTSPWNMNRYTFAAGNPISRIEFAGHLAVCAPDGHNFCPDYSIADQPVATSTSSGSAGIGRAPAAAGSGAIGSAPGDNVGGTGALGSAPVGGSGALGRAPQARACTGFDCADNLRVASRVATGTSWVLGIGEFTRQLAKRTEAQWHHLESPDRWLRSQATQMERWYQRLETGNWARRGVSATLNAAAYVGHSRFITNAGGAIPVVGSIATGVGSFAGNLADGDDVGAAAGKAAITTGLAVGVGAAGVAIGGLCGPAAVICSPVLGAAGGAAGGWLGEKAAEGIGRRFGWW